MVAGTRARLILPRQVQPRLPNLGLHMRLRAAENILQHCRLNQGVQPCSLVLDIFPGRHRARELFKASLSSSALAFRASVRLRPVQACADATACLLSRAMPADDWRAAAAPARGRAPPAASAAEQATHSSARPLRHCIAKTGCERPRALAPHHVRREAAKQRSASPCSAMVQFFCMYRQHTGIPVSLVCCKRTCQW